MKVVLVIPFVRGGDKTFSELKASLRRLTPVLTVTQKLTAMVQAWHVPEVYIHMKKFTK
jgi:hypothetical protein